MQLLHMLKSSVVVSYTRKLDTIWHLPTQRPETPSLALKYFTQAANARRKYGATDTQRVGALIGTS